MLMQIDLNIAREKNEEPLTVLFVLQEVEEAIGTRGNMRKLKKYSPRMKLMKL